MSVAHTERETVLLDHEAVERTLSRIAHEIIEANPDLDKVALVGIHTRGVPLAQRCVAGSPSFTGSEVALGQLDITFYRDDVHVRGGEAPQHAAAARPRLEARLPARRDAPCVLVDDVLYTGRTIRAAIEALFDYGRPARVQLAVLADRGHRELPIRPDYVGKNFPTIATSASRCSSSRSTRSTASCSSRASEEGSPNG